MSYLAEVLASIPQKVLSLQQRTSSIPRILQLPPKHVALDTIQHASMMERMIRTTVVFCEIDMRRKHVEYPG
jgi:hypothetical protein